ncbi:uncharacterized protein EV154DRAFT_507231 [Mucor mucedo]|uniref:uncharacterized protein n=1 Tax=Mucor mucedo TaxID=29922 RepID=UPI00221FEE27|nr:uncharacterized protein EV154DRAFT_507231 [Mucor mucedo]KAI7891800.1 hypothetical protein EV154DRAFT_507231 [Mucor mucedo]
MEYLSFTALVADAWKTAGYPAIIIAYIRIAINGFIALWSCYKILRREKGGSFWNIGFVLCAAIIGLVANINYVTVLDDLKTFWLGNLCYNAVLWLSCITTFSSLSTELKDVAGSLGTRIIGRLHIYTAYAWTVITFVSGYYLKEILVENYTEMTFAHQQEGPELDNLLQPFYLILFAYFNKSIFTVMLLILFVSFAKYLKLISKAYNSILAFGVLATVPIVTDTFVLSFALRLKEVTTTDAITSLVLNFIFTDCFYSAALIIVLIYSKYWVFSSKEIKLFFEE